MQDDPKTLILQCIGKLYVLHIYIYIKLGFDICMGAVLKVLLDTDNWFVNSN